MKYEMILDFSDEDITIERKVKLINAIINGKKLRTNVTYFGDGTYNSLYGDLFSLDFSTNTLMQLGDEIGFSYSSKYSDEEMEEILEDLNEFGFEDTWKEYENNSVNDFLD